MNRTRLVTLHSFRSLIWKIEVYLFPIAILVILAQAFDFLSVLFGIGAWSAIPAVLFMVWLIAVLIQMILLAVSSTDREFFIQNLCGIEERDEREEIIVARASRVSFTVTTTLLVIFLVTSTFRYTKPLDETAPKGFYSFTVGHVSFLDSNKLPHEVERDGQKQQVITYDFPISKFGIIFILFASQIGTLVFRGRFRERHD